MTEYKEYSWLIGEGLGINITKESKICGAGYCKKHGHFTLSLENFHPNGQCCGEYKCPYCEAEK